MSTFHLFHVGDGWEVYQEGMAGMVSGPHITSWQAIDATRLLYPSTCVIYVHRHQIDELCSACERFDLA